MRTKGWKTSEFWVSLAAAAIPLANQAFGLHLPTEQIMTVVAPLIGYALSRGIAKHGQPQAAVLPLQTATLESAQTVNATPPVNDPKEND